jgi:signal transduction histidine kinase
MDRGVLEHLPLPTVVVDGDFVAEVNDLAVRLLDRPRAELEGRRWLEFVVPADRARLAERNRRRVAGEVVPTVYETTILGARAEPIRVQVRLAYAGGRAVLHLVDLRTQAQRRERLELLATLGADVQRRATEAEIHRAVRTGLLALGLHPTFLALLPDGRARIEWAEDGTEVPLLQKLSGLRVEGLVLPMTEATEEIVRAGARYLDDWPLEVERFVGLPGAAAMLRTLEPAGYFERGVAARIDAAGQPAGILAATGEWLTPDDVAPFRLFGAQFSAALDAARRVAELEQRNAELGTLNRLSAAVADAPDAAAMLARVDGVVREATGCVGVALLVFDPGHAVAVLQHGSRLPPRLHEQAAQLRLDHSWVQGTVAEGARCVVPEDLPPALAEAMREAGRGSAAAVALRFRAGTFGMLVADFDGPVEAARSRVPILQAMAAQLAAGLESHRLRDDLRLRVSELTLLNDLASATGPLDPVLLLDGALRRIADTLRAEFGTAYLLEGTEPVLRASVGIDPDLLDRAPPQVSVAKLAIARGGVVRSPPELLDDPRRRFVFDVAGLRSAVAIPLLAQERALGALVLGRRRAVEFGDDEVRLLSVIGAQLGMAVENARLFADTRRRVTDLEAVNSLALRVFTTAPGDSARLLQATCREIAQALDAETAVILRVSDDRRHLVAVAAWGAPAPLAELTLELEQNPVAADALRSQEPTWAADVVLRSGPRSSPALSVLFVPLTSRAATRGLVAVADASPRRFDEAEVALAYALASEAAMGLENAELYGEARRRVDELSRLNEENARLYEDLRRSYAELARAQEQLIQQERLAALGQLAAVVAHEVRNPLGVIFNSLGALRRLLQPQGDPKMLLDIVGEEADRLNRIVGDLLDFARPATPRLRAEPLDRVLDEAAQAAAAEAAGRVRVERDVPTDLPQVPMDARLVRQALLNVMSNAVQAMDGGGTLTVRARAEDGAVRVEIADTGSGIPEEVRHRIFEPFFTTRATGTGLGLAVVKRILDDHRATIEVESTEGAGTRFVVRLPLGRDVPVENDGGVWSV